jgi:putative membrane protein
MRPSKISELLFVFLKGLAMGSADIIPGVSGGTIALITGIYERFVFALQSINIHFLYYFMLGFKDKTNFKKAKNSFFSIDFLFLIPLAVGIACAFLTLANILGFLLETVPTQTFAFFFGLIFASAFYVYYTHKSIFKLNSMLFIGLGILFGFLIVGLESIQLDHSPLMIFASGIISFCAMILPGLSGAFILLVLGQYEFLLDVLRQLTHFEFGMILFVFSYIFGGLIGLLGFSRVLSFLFSKYKSATIAFITGLMIGALRKPGMEMLRHPDNLAFTLGSLVLGILVVTFFSVYELKIKKTSMKK